MTPPDATDPAASAEPLPADTVSLRIAAPADRLYALVSDPAGMGRLSPECTGGKWLGGATWPAVGARFRGYNKRGVVRWFTTSTVVAAEPGRHYAFETGDSGTRWGYRFEPDGDGTVVTEYRQASKPYPLLAKVFTTVLLGGVGRHTEELRDGMRATLERLRAVAEGGADA
jgi:hypothetical protein